MTEAELLKCEDAHDFLDSVSQRVSVRKIRLALCASLRSPDIWQVLSAPISRQAVETGEAFADGMVSIEELGRIRKRANAVARNGSRGMPPCSPGAYLANYICSQDHTLTKYLYLPMGCIKQLQPPADLLRDIFGNPFHPIAFVPKWRSETAVALASAIYAERAFDRMPILADALEEAGCDHADVLSHCRGPGPHVRGCWVVDGVLGKE
jgi:hypothetical protein